MADEGDRDSGPARPPGSSAAVRVIIDLVGQLMIKLLTRSFVFNFSCLRKALDRSVINATDENTNFNNFGCLDSFRLL